MDSVMLWIWLSLSCAPAAAWSAWKALGSVERVYAAGEEELRAIPNLREEHICGLCGKSTQRAERILERCGELGVYVFCWDDEDYPRRLRELHLPPMVLYQWGQPLRLGEECAVAMAGTRRCSAYARMMAERFSEELTRQGAVVVTGMAPGCDEAALRAALRVEGPVVALLPGGVDVPYEMSDYYRSLYRDVRQKGALLSPYPPGTWNDHRHFLYRNPILTGITAATLCVESGVPSGVLNVARNASEQQRPLYVVPANLDNPKAAGTNALLCTGVAMPVMSAKDILLPFQASFPQLHLELKSDKKTGILSGRRGSRGTLPEGSGEAEQGDQYTGLEEKGVDTGPQADYIDLQTGTERFTEQELSVIAALAEGEKTAEELSALTGIGSPEVLSALSLLTLQGALEELGGGRFRSLVRIRDEQQK